MEYQRWNEPVLMIVMRKSSLPGPTSVKTRMSERKQRRFLLAFEDEDFEKDFLNRYFDRNLSHFRLCMALAVLLYSLVFAAQDYFLFREVFLWMWFVRVGVIVPAFVVGLVLSYAARDLYRRIWPILHTFFVLITGIGVIALILLPESPLAIELYSCLVFSLVFNYTFIRHRFIWAVLGGVSVTIAFVVTYVLMLQEYWQNMMIQLPVVLGVNALGMFVAYTLEQNAREEFVLTSRLADTNTELEERVRKRTSSLESVIGELRAANEQRTRLEAQLLQSQKMEAIGRLAGGVAHDFNNLITAIRCNAEFISCDAAAGQQIRTDAGEILAASDSAANLTRALLAFSRQEIATPRVLDLDSVIRDSCRMFDRMLGEDISLKVDSQPGLLRVLMDSGQLQQVLLNLAVNARDAMPDGGTIEIESRNTVFFEESCRCCGEIRSGPFVVVEVSDTGCGISREVLPSIFDPFFTTKPRGSGTGLGLSTVIGIVHQHGGHVDVRTSPGEGTTFSLCFPAVDSMPAPAESPTDASVLTGNCCVMVVEDDPAMRRATQRVLEEHGYRVQVAGSGKTAIEIINRGGFHFDLLLADVILSDTHGPELAEEIVSLVPSIAVLFMSGYSEGAIAHQGVLDPGVAFLQKPFGADQLLLSVRRSMS